MGDVTTQSTVGDVTTQSTIWKFVGGLSAITGVVSFALGSSYDMSFGKLGYGGFLVYLLVCLIMGCLIVWDEGIRVSEGVQGVVVALIFIMISVISVLLEKYLPQKSDAFTITSYCSFALMSLSLSRKLALGFETGFSAFFLQLFASQLFKIKWFLFPIALVFCSVIIILRHDSETGVQFLHHYSESGVQFLRHYLELGVQFFRHNPEPEVQEVGSIPSNNGSDPPPNSVAIDIEGQHSPQRRLLPPNNQQPNDQVPAGQHSPQQRLLPPNNQQPNDQVPTEQERVSSGNNQNGRMPDSAGAGLFPPAPPGLRWRRPRMPTGIVLYFWNSYHSKSRWSHA